MFIQKDLFHTCLLANNKPQLTAFGGVGDDFQGQTCLADEGLLHANHCWNCHPTRQTCLANEGLLHGFGLVLLAFLAPVLLPLLGLGHIMRLRTLRQKVAEAWRRRGD